MNKFKVSLRSGRWKYFATLEAASAYADMVFQKTGIIVGVQATRSNVIRMRVQKIDPVEFKGLPFLPKRFGGKA